jgi:hypothetical protein
LPGAGRVGHRRASGEVVRGQGAGFDILAAIRTGTKGAVRRQLPR